MPLFQYSMKAEIRTRYMYGTKFEVWRPIETHNTLEQAIQYCADEGLELDETQVRHLRACYTVEPEEDVEYNVKF